MANYRKNPKDAIKEFNNFREEVKDCVSLAEIEKVSSILKEKQEWVNYNNSFLSNAVDTKINQLFEDIDLEKKLKHLDELDKENQGIAWRPNGLMDVRQIEGDHLKQMKKNLEKRIEELKTKSNPLKLEISEFRIELLEKEKKMETFLKVKTQDTN